jgi:hypothetical protein
MTVTALVRALSGEAIDRYPVFPSQEEAFGITGPSPVPSADSKPVAAQTAGPPVVLREGDTEVLGTMLEGRQEMTPRGATLVSRFVIRVRRS